MKNRVLAAAVAALLPFAPAVQAQDSTSRDGGYFITTPGPKGTSRWVPTSSARAGVQAERSSMRSPTSERRPSSQPERTERTGSACDCPMMGMSSGGMMMGMSHADMTCAHPMQMKSGDAR